MLAELLKFGRMRWIRVVVTVLSVTSLAVGVTEGRRDYRVIRSGGVVRYSPTVATYHGVVQFGFLAIYAAALIGAVAGTSEWSARTWSATFLLETQRSRVVLAKCIAAAVGGALLALLATLMVTVGSSLGGSAVDQLQLLRSAADALPALVVASALISVLWHVVGLLIRHPLAAVGLCVGEVFVVARLLAQSAPAAARWLPEFAVQGISAAGTGMSYQNAAPPGPGGALMNPPGTGAALAFMGALIVGVGLLACWGVNRSDVQ